MLKKMMVATAFLLGLSMVAPLTAKSSWNYMGRITARDATSLTLFDKEHIRLALDDHTTITHWIREKPFVRATESLTPAALKFGGLVRVRTREGGRTADFIEVASDVKTAFSGPVVAYDEHSLSVHDEDMDTVTLKLGDVTEFRGPGLFTVKPWVRTPARLSATDLTVGARVTVYSSKADRSMADYVEIAK